MNEVDAPAENEADSVSVVGDGGGNVTESYGSVISLAKKFGMRKEEIPVLVKVSKPWNGISVEDLSAKYGKMMPDYDIYQSLMDSVVCMFDSCIFSHAVRMDTLLFSPSTSLSSTSLICSRKSDKSRGTFTPKRSSTYWVSSFNWPALLAS